MIIEDICKYEEYKEIRKTELDLNKLKAGKDIENRLVLNYLTNQHNI
jgi:hypothetical protein